MRDPFFHTLDRTPPRTFVPVVEKTKDAYKAWIIVQRNLPKAERFGLGQKIDQLFLILLEGLHRAAYAGGSTKVTLLGETLLTIDSLRFFIQLAWELKLIPTNQFTAIGQEIEGIGKMVGGWRKGLIAKTPPQGSGEKK